MTDLRFDDRIYVRPVTRTGRAAPRGKDAERVGSGNAGRR